MTLTTIHHSSWHWSQSLLSTWKFNHHICTSTILNYTCKIWIFNCISVFRSQIFVTFRVVLTFWKVLGSFQVIVSLVLTETISGDDLELDLVFDSGVSQCEGDLNTVGIWSVLIMWVEFSSCSGMVSSIYSSLLISFSWRHFKIPSFLFPFFSIGFWVEFCISPPLSLCNCCTCGTVIKSGVVGLRGSTGDMRERDKILAIPCLSMVGRKGRSLCNLWRYLMCHWRVLLGVGVAFLNWGLQILPKHNNFRRSCRYLW